MGEDVSTIYKIVLIFAAGALLLIMCELAANSVVSRKQDAATRERLTQCVEDGYKFTVDGVEIQSLDDDTIGRAYNVYNIVYDDTQKLVVFTTKQAPGGYVRFVPFFLQ